MKAFALALILALAPPALAAPPEDLDRAHTLYRAGSQAYRQGRYDVAIPAFEEARRLAPRPPVLFSLAQAYRLQYFVDGDPEHLTRAVALYRAYIDAIGAGGRRDHAAQHLSTLVPLLQAHEEGAPTAATAPGRLIVSTPIDGATARLGDGEPTATPATFELPPGPATVVVEAPGHRPRRTDTVAVAGSVVALEVPLDPLPARLAIDAAPGTHVRVDGRALGQTPLAPIELPPGRHRVALTAAGRAPHARTIELDRDQEATLTAALDVSGLRVAAIGTLTGGGLLLGGAAIAGALAVDAESDALALEATFTRQGLTATEAARHRRHVADRDDRRLAAGALAAAGITALAVGAVLWIIDGPGDAPPVETGPDGISVRW